MLRFKLVSLLLEPSLSAIIPISPQSEEAMAWSQTLTQPVHCTLQIKHSTLHNSYRTLETSHCTLSTLNTALHNAQFTLHNTQFRLHNAHWTFYTACCTPQAANCTTLHTVHFKLHSAHYAVKTVVYWPSKKPPCISVKQFAPSCCSVWSVQHAGRLGGPQTRPHSSYWVKGEGLQWPRK